MFPFGIVVYFRFPIDGKLANSLHSEPCDVAQWAEQGYFEVKNAKQEVIGLYMTDAVSCIVPIVPNAESAQ